MHALRRTTIVPAANRGARGCGPTEDHKPTRCAYVWAVVAAVAALHCGGAHAAAGGSEVDEVLDRLHSFRAEHAKGPTLADFWKLICDDGGKCRVARSDRRALWNAFSETQRGAISKRDLLELHQATRDAIFDLQFNCELEQRKYEAGAARTIGRFKYKFAMTETKILLWTDKHRDGTAMEHGRSYDGEKVRTFVTHAGATTAQVLTFDSWSPYYVADSNPLFGAMLLDSPRTMGAELPFVDLRLFLDLPGATVFEERRNVRGYDCVVVGIADIQVCVAPMFNFAVVQFSQSSATEDTLPRLAYRCDLSEFVDLGNGVWMPRKMERRFYADGPTGPSPMNEDIATFDDLRINQEIPDAMFTEAIPHGALVRDMVEHVTYIEGDKTSIQSLVDGAMPPRGAHGSARTWLVWSNVLVFVLIMFVLLWHRRRANSRQGSV